MDDIKEIWSKGKMGRSTSKADINLLIQTAEERRKKVIRFHYGNIGILALTLVLLATFFYFVKSFKQSASLFGMVLMIGGLVIRIALEFYSLQRSRALSVLGTAVASTNESIKYYHFRKGMHGVITLFIAGLYISGFYLIALELGERLSKGAFIFMHASFLIGAVFVVFQIKKGIKREGGHLSDLIEIRKDIEKIKESL